MSVVQLLGGICLLTVGSMIAVARVVAFANAVHEGARQARSPDEASSAWHGAILAHVPWILAGVVVGAIGAWLLGWFAG